MHECRMVARLLATGIGDLQHHASVLEALSDEETNPGILECLLPLGPEVDL